MAKTFLVVDDSRVARTLTKRVLSEIEPGVEFKEASTGDEAIAIANASPVDFVFMDMNMPGVDGLTAAGKILEARPGQKVALVTANIQDSVRERAGTMGIRFLGKPLQKAEAEALLKS